MLEPDVLLTGGIIRTMDPACPRASALAVRGGRVLVVGGEDLRDLAGPGTRVVDLEGRCVLPGLADSHIHFAGFTLGLRWVDLAGTDSLEEVLQKTAERVGATPPGEWILGRGWDQERWPDRRFPCAADVDRVAPHHPVTLIAKSGHALVANSMAMQRAGVTESTPDPDGGRVGRDAGGDPTGMMLEEAMGLITAIVPRPDADVFAAALPGAFRRAWEVGLTAVHEMAIHEVDDRTAFGVYQQLHARGELGLRVVKYLPTEALDDALAIGLRTGLGDDWLRVGGIKVFTDGALGSRTAAMLEPYVGEPENLGLPVIEPAALQDLARRATAGGLALAIHAIGDRANRMALDALAQAGEDGKTLLAPVRHRIEHVQIIHPDDVGRLAALGAVASVQPIHATQDAPMADRYWGPRCTGAYAWRDLLDAGAVLAFGSDCPVECLNPFLGIHAAVTRACPEGYGGPDGWYPQQRLSVEEAVRAYTWGAAYAVGLEDRLGSLAPGKRADLVVLDRDIFTCEAAAIAETAVMGTMIGGAWVFGGWATG
jgi:predicted amidohydrolase YtcJ